MRDAALPRLFFPTPAGVGVATPLRLPLALVTVANFRFTEAHASPIFAALMLPIVINVLLVIHVLVSLLIILLVLMQRPKNEGLGAAFGGGATDQLFGAQTTNVLQTITRWLGGMFFALTLLLSILYVKQGGGHSPIQDKLTAPVVIPDLPPAADGKPLLELPPATTEPVKGDGTAPAAENPPGPPAPGTPVVPAPVPAPAAPPVPAPDAAPSPAPPENKPAEPAPEPKPPEPAK